MKILLDTSKADDYRTFLRIKALPRYSFSGRMAEFPDEYADRIGIEIPAERAHRPYESSSFLFDYQRDIAATAIRKRKYAVFADPGLGKTLMMGEFARHVAGVLPRGQCGLIVSPLMVVEQTLEEFRRFYGDALSVEWVRSADLPRWLDGGSSRLGITNYEALKFDLPRGRLGALMIDESSSMKSHYGKWGTSILRLGRRLDWKLCLTGTPAPNDRIEYANHAVFLDAFPTVNSFLARFFVNRGQTAERWEMKPHALRPFYRALSHWCIFLTDPATYGWKDNVGNIPPILVHIDEVPLTSEQRVAASHRTGRLFAGDAGGITKRSTLGQLAKGRHEGKEIPTNKPAFIRALVDSWTPEESTLIWCLYNAEQATMARAFPDAASIEGATPYEARKVRIDDFKAARRPVLISKPKVLGFGLNLQVATRQVFSGLQDSYEQFYQAVKRSNRVGSTKPLNVHIPVTELEEPMVDTVLRKARRIEQDTREQEEEFRNASA